MSERPPNDELRALIALEKSALVDPGPARLRLADRLGDTTSRASAGRADRVADAASTSLSTSGSPEYWHLRGRSRGRSHASRVESETRGDGRDPLRRPNRGGGSSAGRGRRPRCLGHRALTAEAERAAPRAFSRGGSSTLGAKFRPRAHSRAASHRQGTLRALAPRCGRRAVRRRRTRPVVSTWAARRDA